MMGAVMMIFQQLPPSTAASVDLTLAQLFFIISIVALALSIGLFIAIIYLLKRGQFTQSTVSEHMVKPEMAGEAVPEERVKEITALMSRVERVEQQLKNIEDRVSGLERRVAGIEEAVKGLRGQFSTLMTQVSGLEKRIQGLEARLNYIVRSSKAGVKQPVFAPPIVRGKKEAPHIGELNSLGDLKLYVPQLQYAALITSQGYLVEKYGQLTEDPPKLLEVVKISEKFTNSREITIVRGDQRISIFHVGKSEDLDVYGILAVKKDVAENVINAMQEAIITYFRRKYGAQ